MAKHVTDEMKAALRHHMEMAGKVLDAAEKMAPEEDDEACMKDMQHHVGEMCKASGFQAAPAAEPEAPAAPTEPVATSEAIPAGVVALAGSSDPAKVLGAVTAWKESHDKVAALSARVTELEAEKKEVEKVSEFDTLVTLGEKERKLSPDQVKNWIPQLRTMDGGATVLTSYLEHTSPLVTPEVIAPAGGVSQVISLSAEDKHVAKLLGNDLDAVAAARKSQLEEQAKRKAQATDDDEE